MGYPSCLQCGGLEQILKLYKGKAPPSGETDGGCENKLTEREDQLFAHLPHKYNDIVSRSNSQITTVKQIYEKLYSGIFLDDWTKKYWIDKKTHSNGFKLFADGLIIPRAYEPRYGKWSSENETTDVKVEVVELTGVSWLQIEARMDTTLLSPEVLYEVAFVLMMKDDAFGWEYPVILGLQFSIGIKEEHKKDLREITERNRWTEIRVGEFVTSIQNEGNLKIYLRGSEGSIPKGGLAVKCVIVRPKAKVKTKTKT